MVGVTNLNGAGHVDLLVPNANGNYVVGNCSVISGGLGNTNLAPEAFIGAGSDNAVASGAQYAAIGGGFSNSIGSYTAAAVIGGGWQNSILGSSYEGTIAGGWVNSISNSEQATIAGGEGNVLNSAWGLIRGGLLQLY